jgi:hypothetical protein
MITITCDRCGVDITEKILKKLSTLKKKGDQERFDKIGWILAMALEFNVFLNRPFLFCTKCTGIRSLEELGQEKVVDYDRLKLYRDWIHSGDDSG